MPIDAITTDSRFVDPGDDVVVRWAANTSPEPPGEFGAIRTPADAAVPGETTGDPTTMALRARAAIASLELFGFNKNQKRGPDGRWIKGLASRPASALEQRRTELADSVASGVRSSARLGNSGMARVDRVELGDGTEAIHKITINSYEPPDGPVWTAANQTDAEELVSELAAGLGVRAPAVQRVQVDSPWGMRPHPLEIYMEMMPGQTGVAAGWFNDAPRRERVLASKDALKLGLLDVLTNNPDRHGYNWLIDDQDRLYAIDHGLGFSGNSANPGRSDAQTSTFANPYVDASGAYASSNPLTPGDVDHVREVLEGLRPTFAARGHGDWIDTALARLDMLARGARGSDSIYGGLVAAEDLFGFNPHQLRGPDGKWIKMPTHLRKERRRERDRARREAKKAEKQRADKTETDIAPPDRANAAHRVQRDAFNLKVIQEATNIGNDLAFDGEVDNTLDNRLAELNDALLHGDHEVIDRRADALYDHLAAEYPDADLPDRPSLPVADAPSPSVDQAALDQKLADQLADYYAEIHVTGKAWVDMLRDPEVRDDPDSGLDHLPDAFVNLLGSHVLALRKAVLNDDQDNMRLYGDEIRRMLVGHDLQADHDFPEKPTMGALLAEARAQAGVPTPVRTSSGLLTSGAPLEARRAALEAAAAGGTWGDEPIGQGAMGETKKVVFNNGVSAIYKKAKGDWGGSIAGDPWTPKHQTDAEEMASLVGSALGLRAPAVQRLSDDEINMELVENAAPAMNRYFDRTAPDYVRVPSDVLGSDEGLLMGIFDALIDNPDRHGYNWMVSDDGHLYPIDHGLAFMNVRGSGTSLAARSPFAQEYFVTPSGQYKENILSRRDIAYLRQQLEPLQAEFDRIGRQSWGVAMMQRLDHLERLAKGGASHQLPAPREEQ